MPGRTQLRPREEFPVHAQLPLAPPLRFAVTSRESRVDAARLATRDLRLVTAKRRCAKVLQEDLEFFTWSDLNGNGPKGTARLACRRNHGLDPLAVNARNLPCFGR